MPANEPDSRPERQPLTGKGGKVSGERHPGTLTTMNNLASTLKARGEHEEAEAMEREVRDLQA